MISAGPAKRLNNCRYCKEGNVGLIYPEDKYAQKMDDGSWKCGPCVLEDIQKAKVRVLEPNHPEVNDMIAVEEGR